MADCLAEELKRNIPLSEMIESLRQELKVALSRGEGERVRFEVKKVELELRIAITREDGLGGKLKFGVVEAGGKLGKTQQDTHVFRLELEPCEMVMVDGEPRNRPLFIADSEPKRPAQG
ncbi:MAG: hypothetical protein JW940_16640 [Polyangiaceae bacterium]|nr:hypothetical protein [Polyangiaceae bacterium]